MFSSLPYAPLGAKVYDSIGNRSKKFVGQGPASYVVMGHPR